MLNISLNGNTEKLIAAFLMSSLMVSCFFPLAMSHQPPIDTSTYYLERTAQPFRLDPARAYDLASGELLQNVVQPLIWWNDKPVVPFTPGVGHNLTVSEYASLESYSPVLATEVPSMGNGRIVINASGEYYTFTINTSATFQPWTAGNGSVIPSRALTASDVVYSFRRQMVYDSPYGPTWIWFEPAFGIMGFADAVGGPFPVYPNGTFKNPADEATAAVMIQSWCYPGPGVNDVSFHFQNPRTPDVMNQIFAHPLGGILEPEWVMERGGWNGQFPAGWTNLWHVKPTVTRSEIDAWKDPAIYGPVAGSKYPSSAKHVSEIMGTGPYLFTSWDQANKNWRIDAWNSTNSLDSSSFWANPTWIGNHVLTVIAKTTLSWPTRKVMFLDGEFDEIDVSPNHYSELETTPYNPVPGISEVYNIAALSNAAVFFTVNVSAASPYQSFVGSPVHLTLAEPLFFNNSHIRKAFAWALSYVAYITAAYSGEATQQASWWVDGLGPPSWKNTALTLRDLNYTEMQNELNQAIVDGYNVSQVGFETTLLYDIGNSQRQTALEMIAAAFMNLGLKYKCNVVGLDWQQYIGAMNSHYLPVFCLSWEADFVDPDDFARVYMYSTGYFPYNQGPPYHDDQATIDAEIDAAVTEPNMTQRGQLYKDLQAKYYDDCCSFALVQPLSRRWTRDWVQGWYYNPLLPGDYFYDLYKSVTALQNVDVAMTSVTPATPGPSAPGNTPGITYIFHNQMRIGNGSASPDVRNYILNVTRNDFNGAIGSLYTTISLTYTSATNGKQAANSSIVNLMPGGSASASMTFWADGTNIVMAGNSTGIPYAIAGEAWPINNNANDTNPANNVQAAGTLTAKTLPGDITGNGLVDIYDAIQLANAFGTHTGDKRYNPDADCNGDGNVDIYDAIILAANFNKHVP